jgi:CBS domain-containing protein
MVQSLRRPEEILAYRPLRQVLAAKPSALWTVGPRDSALSAMRLMADKNIGLLVVADIMVRDVVKADIGSTFADCLKLMHSHRVRHLPVMEDGVVIGVISIRDLLSEAVAHHAKVIGELEKERLTMITSTA